MSGKVIDVRQATLNALVERFGQLTEAIVASNVRYVRIQEEVTNGFADMRRLIGDSVGDAETRLTKRINETHSADGRTVTADVAAKAVRKAQAVIAEHGTDGVAALLQGKLGQGDVLLEAGLVAQVKAPKPAATA